MDLANLIASGPVAKKSSFTVRGEYGILVAWIDGGHYPCTHEPTYWVDATYYPKNSHSRIHRCQRGFRLSTIFCMCACICAGEQAVNESFIQQLNQWFGSVRVTC
ncbi:MAG: hypothetical protein V7629_08135 [Motiliproteus sp.]